MADKYLIVMMTVLVVTQVIRVTQNTISLIRQNQRIKRGLDRIGDITNEDIEVQKKFYKLACEHLAKQKEDEEYE